MAQTDVIWQSNIVNVCINKSNTLDLLDSIVINIMLTFSFVISD